MYICNEHRQHRQALSVRPDFLVGLILFKLFFMYRISKYTLDQAKKLNVIVRPSTNKNKKIDVYDRYGDFITSVGARNYSDYPTYIKTHGIAYAKNRRRLYKLRHKKDRHVRNSAGWFADKLLW